MTFYVTRSYRTYHWTLDCPSLRRAQIRHVLATEQNPPSPRDLCRDCLRIAGPPAGYQLTKAVPQGLLDRVREARAGFDD